MWSTHARFRESEIHGTRWIVATALFQFPAYKKAGALLNTRYEVSNGRPMPIAAPTRSDAAAVECVCNIPQCARSGILDSLDHGHQVCGEFIRRLGLCGAPY